jgi:phage anti-repressor protein
MESTYFKNWRCTLMKEYDFNENRDTLMKEYYFNENRDTLMKTDSTVTLP